MAHRPAPLSQSMTVNTFAAGIFAVVVSVLAMVAPANASWFGWGDRTAVERCERGVDHFVEEMTERAEDEVTFTSTQQAAWDDLIAAVQEGGKEITTFCAEIDEARAAERAPATKRLAMAEQGMTVGLKAMQIIRPAFDAFYDTLDAEQKEMLDGHRRRGWWH
ncbi:MAG: Spy/CpxP family protein refolding chaperone [Rhodobiaceae bacterium]|nr:Spy/CpxP family protein refolding chaperone [Rhodobiaceae bacterium]